MPEDGGNIPASRMASPSPWLPSLLAAPQDQGCRQDPAGRDRKEKSVSHQAQLLPRPVLLAPGAMSLCVCVLACACARARARAHTRACTNRVAEADSQTSWYSCTGC